MQLFPSPSSAGTKLCAQTDPDVFFPDRITARSTATAKAICARCSFRAECLRQALTRPEEYGVWGGLDEKELRSLRRTSRARAS
ncbi:WhiB family transcriptional regulator [Streptomyces sp. NPDC004288]